MNSPRLPPTDDHARDDDDREKRRREDREKKRREEDRRRQRWTCWGVALALVFLWVVFVAIEEGRRIGELPAGTNALFLLVVLVLVGAGWVLGRDDQTAELIELNGRNAALAETIVHLETEQHERLGEYVRLQGEQHDRMGVYVRQSQRMVSEVHQLAEDLEALRRVVVEYLGEHDSEGEGEPAQPSGNVLNLPTAETKRALEKIARRIANQRGEDDR